MYLDYWDACNLITGVKFTRIATSSLVRHHQNSHEDVCHFYMQFLLIKKWSFILFVYLHFFPFVLPADLTGNIPIVSAESGQAAMEAWNSATRSDNILESYVTPPQIMACSGPWLRPKCQTEGNRTGCCHTLQWKHEALAWNWHAKISKLLGKICQLWSSLFAGLQHQSLRS